MTFSMSSDKKIIGLEKGLKAAITSAELVAKTDLPVLLQGETGTGKEIIARHIHEFSKRAKGNFLRINCAAIAPQLLDSELFGHEKGSFTGATSQHRGWFERANHGTLLLDEVGELSMEAQTRLLRVLNDGSLYRVGSEKALHVSVRIIAATHKNLKESVQEKSFREDLWYRINTFPIHLPPLRERLEDIEELTQYYVEKSASRYGMKTPEISKKNLSTLSEYDWPGNIREFIAVIERAVLLGQGDHLETERALGMSFANTLKKVEKNLPDTSLVTKDLVKKTLTQTLGRIEGPFGAAQILSMNPSTLRSKMKKWGIESKNKNKRI